VHIQWHQGVTSALHFANQPIDFQLVQQQFSGAHRIGMDVRRSIQQRADVRPEQIQRPVLYSDVGFLELRASGADGLDFPAFQHDACFIFILNEVFVIGLFVLDDAHIR
jgi:hypothetical protein